VDWLTDPFTSYTFFGRALLVLVLAGGICGALGAFVVVRRMSYIAHGLSHAVIGGAAVAAVLDLHLLLGAAAWAFLSALLIDRVSRRRGLYPDTAIGIVTTTSFALGIAVISAVSGVRLNLESFLFGSVLGVSGPDLVLAGTVTVVVAAVLFTRYRPLLFTTFDPEVAAAQGVPAGRYQTLFALLLTAGIVASMRVLGVLLVAAAVVVPPATARLLTDRFERLLPLAAGLGAASAVPGMYLSWYLDLASGPAVVLVQAAVLAAAWAWTATRERLGAGARTGWPAGTAGTTSAAGMGSADGTAGAAGTDRTAGAAGATGTARP
jgi:manganese/iron transport system permease protein/iron/zinc/copper transport system permease protein